MRADGDVVGGGAVVEGDGAVERLQHDAAVASGRDHVGLRGVGAGDQRVVGLHFLDRDGHVIDDEAVGLREVDTTGGRPGGQGRDLGFKVVGRRAQANRSHEAQAGGDQVLAAEGIAAVEDRTGLGDQRGVAAGGQATEVNAGVSVHPDVTGAADQAAVIGLREGARAGDHINRAGAARTDIRRRRERDVRRGQDRDVAGARVHVRVDGDIGAGGEGRDQDVAGAVRADGGVVGTHRAVVQRDVTIERLKDDAAVASRGQHIRLAGGNRDHGRIGLHLLDRDRDVVHDQSVGLEEVDAAGGGAGRQDCDLGFEMVGRQADARAGDEPQAGGDHVLAAEGVAIVEDGAGGRREADIARGRQAAEEDVHLRHEADVARGRHEPAIVVLRQAAGTGHQVDRRRTRGHHVGGGGEGQVMTGQHRDVAAAGEQVGVDRDVAGRVGGFDQDVAGAMRADGDVVGGGAVVQRD